MGHLEATYSPINEPLRAIIFKWKLGFRFDGLVGEFYHQYCDVHELKKYTIINRNKGDRHDEESWNELENSLVKHGWDPKQPLLFLVYASGRAVVSDGNHRLKMVLGLCDEHEHLRKAPVIFHFSETK